MKLKSVLIGCTLVLVVLFMSGFSTKAEAQNVIGKQTQIKPVAAAKAKAPQVSTKPSVPVAEQVKKVALTFDDGPDHKYTKKVLEILKDKGVHATFFVVGKQVKLYPDMLKEIAEEGHAIGNHSWDHKDFTKITNAQMKQQIAKTDQAIKDAVGTSTTWFRAPYGAKNKQVKDIITKSGNQDIGWTIDTRDWAGTTSQQMMANVKKNLKPNGIILMHSFGGKGGKLDNMIEFLPQLIDYLQKENYTLVTIPELYAKE